MRVSNRKTVTGTVRTDKMEKSITIDVVSRTKHPKYGKYILKTKRLVAHDEQNEANVGDEVEVVETRPLSKSKRWRLVRVIKRGNSPESAR